MPVLIIIPKIVYLWTAIACLILLGMRSALKGDEIDNPLN